LDEIAWVVDIQRSQWDTTEKVTFTINIGIYVPGLMSTYGGMREPEHPQSSDCCVSVRIGKLLSNKDLWWEISNNDTTERIDDLAAQVTDAIANYALPYLTNINGIADLIILFRTAVDGESVQGVINNSFVSTAYLGILYSLIHDHSSCCKYIAKSLEQAGSKPGSQTVQQLSKILCN
jgi:hypothetical protein